VLGQAEKLFNKAQIELVFGKGGGALREYWYNLAVEQRIQFAR
jgi:hypothetical protein